MTAEGYIQPGKKYLDKMFFRKPGLPILMVRMPDGSKVPYWNTFYQKVFYDSVDTQDLLKQFHMQYASAEKLAEIINKQLQEGVSPADMDLGRWADKKPELCAYLDTRRKYLGQMDLNLEIPLGVGFLQGHPKEAGRLRCCDYSPGRVCLCAESARAVITS